MGNTSTGKKIFPFNTHTHSHSNAHIHMHTHSYTHIHTRTPPGILKKIEKDERKAAIAVELAKFGPDRCDLYLPTNPDCRVVSHIQTSGTPMQSAAKVGCSCVCACVCMCACVFARVCVCVCLCVCV
jgi:hypothetical protein